MARDFGPSKRKANISSNFPWVVFPGWLFEIFNIDFCYTSPTLELPSPTVIRRPTATATDTMVAVDIVTPARSASTATATQTATYEDPRKSLAPGQYVVFWRQNTWYIQGLDGSPPVRLMPVESPNFYSGISPDGEKVVFLTADDQIAVYELSTGKLTTYPDLILG